MDTATSGLIGAAIGALAGMGGTIITQALQSNREHKRWVQDKREEAYSKSIRYLLRVLNKRSKLTPEGAIIGLDAIKEWFDDLNEAQAWLTSLAIYCSDNHKKMIADLLNKLNESVASLIRYDSVKDKERKPSLVGIIEVCNLSYSTIVSCARQEIGRYIK